MNELTIAGKKYISSKRAAEITGYAKDYVGQLCREGYVEATMVGRSWYALESSIMEHRFGKESKDEAAESEETKVASQSETPVAPSVAQTPVYTREEVSNIPVVIKNVANAEYPVSESRDEKSSVGDMQSAWQEWFLKKQGTLIESPEVIEERYEDLEQNDFSVPVNPVYESHDTASLSQIRYENTPARPAFDVLNPVQAPVEAKTPESIEDIIPIHKVPETVEEEDFGTFTSYPVTRKTKRSRSSSIVLRAVLLSAAIIALAISAIGSGLAEKYISSSVLQGNSVINFLEGKSELNK